MKIDEINLTDIARTFRKKILAYVLFFLVLMCFGVIYAQQLPDKFKSYYLLTEKSEDASVNLDFGNIGFLSSSVQNQDSLNFKEKLNSNKFFNRLLLTEGFLEGLLSDFTNYKKIEDPIKRDLINNPNFKILGKTKQQLKNYFKNQLFLFLQTANTYEIGIIHQNPEIAKSMIEIVYATFIDTYVQEEINDLERQLDYFKIASSQEKIVDLKEAYSSKIIEIMNSIYVLKGTESYFYVIDNPQVSTIPSAPNRLYIYIVFFIAAIFFIFLHTIYYLNSGHRENQ